MTVPVPSTEPIHPRTWSNPQQLVGTTLDGRYKLNRVLGAGGMGAVFEGEQVTLRKEVAVKVLDPQLAENPTHVERFLREARAASKIRNLHVVDINDFGEVPGGSVYFVMELLDGRDLSHVIRESQRLPWPRAKAILLQVMHALQAAHDHGVVHRDVKPANCVIMPDPDEPGRDFVKVVDFGIAKMLELEGDGAGLTRPNEIMGTVAYMAPEQALCRPVDVRTDIYSLGIVAYEMLTGHVPFASKSAFDVLDMHCKLAPPSMRSLVNDISPALDDVILRALQKRPEDRYQDMRDFERALRSIDEHGQHVVEEATDFAIAPTISRDAPMQDSSPPGVPHGATYPQGAAITNPRPTNPRPITAVTSSGLSTRNVLLLWVFVIGGGVVLGAWIVARFLVG